MATGFRKHRAGLALMALAVIIALAVTVYPWKPWLENRLKTALEAQGFKNVHLTLSGVGLTRISLENLSVGEAPPLTLKNVALDYSLTELISGRVHSLSLSGLDIEARQTGGKWAVSGLTAGQDQTQAKTSLSIPLTPEELVAIPFSEARLENGLIRILAEKWKLETPLQLAWSKGQEPQVKASAEAAKYSFQTMEAAVGSISAEVSLKPGEKQWQGPWRLKDLKITGAGADIPVLVGTGTIAAWTDQIVVQGRFGNADKSVKADFRADYFLNAPDKSKLVIVEASMPWHEGTLLAQEATVLFGEKKPFTANIKIQHVSAEALLRDLTGGKATASGTLSGVLPMTIQADGTILVHQGTLEAEGPGVLSLPPDIIPGDQEQVAFVRNVLGNFHYSHLSIHADSDKNNKLSLLMTLQGQNPDVSLGRPVKVNVRLTGDVLGFVQQNLLWLINPATFMEQGEHAKK